MELSGRTELATEIMRDFVENTMKESEKEGIDDVVMTLHHKKPATVEMKAVFLLGKDQK